MMAQDLLAGPGSSTVGIVGAGVIGTELAAAAASAGHDVRITDRDRAKAAAAEGTAVERAADLAGCDVLVEAVTEDRATKLDALRALAELGATALLLTTTSSFTVTELAAALRTPGRVAGLHRMPAARLCELVPGEHTGAATLDGAREFATGLGWDVLTVADRPGRVTRRLLMPFVNQVVQAYDDGLASAEDIDRVVELGLGHRVGPLAGLDAAGLDDHLAASRQTFDAVHDRALAPPPLLARLVAAGRCGDKSGAGFRRDREGRDQ